MIKKGRHLSGCCRRLRKTHIASSWDLVGHAFRWRCTSCLDGCSLCLHEQGNGGRVFSVGE